MPPRLLPLLLVLPIVLAGCGSATEDDLSPLRRSPMGIVATENPAGYAATVQRLDTLLQNQPAIGVAARIDHAANADAADLSLRPTHVTLFGSPELGTPLMQANPRAGLDLPHKLLVYASPDGRALVVYNSVPYLAQRHGLDGVETLRPMRVALRGLAEQVGDGTVAPADSVALAQGAGLIEMTSSHSVDATVQRLQAAIEQHEALSVMATVDHTANAARVGLELPPMRLLIFGNPQLGTPLMQAAPTMALDLPQKMLVYEATDGTVRIAYNDPAFLAERHVLTGQPERLQTITQALDALAEQAGGPS